MSAIEIAKKRYATKKFNSNFQLTAHQVDEIKQLLQLSPSSINSQPWHFFITSNQAGKQKIAKAAHGPFHNNEEKILDSAMSIVFCAKTEINQEHIDKLIQQEIDDGRLKDEAAIEGAKKSRAFFTGIHQDLHDTQCWAARQVYLNMGNLLYALGKMDLDAVPIEGVDMDVLNQEFELENKGLQALAIVAIGEKHPDDFNAKLPKSRFPIEDIITEI